MTFLLFIKPKSSNFGKPNIIQAIVESQSEYKKA